MDIGGGGIPAPVQPRQGTVPSVISALFVLKSDVPEASAQAMNGNVLEVKPSFLSLSFRNAIAF
jgi:hypothetical protein